MIENGKQGRSRATVIAAVVMISIGVTATISLAPPGQFLFWKD
jgi:hypothetical protein